MIKAIETRYAGCHFRSRLEARWAVFFDHLGIEWEYEPEGFETSAGNYLPDFRIRVPDDSYPYWFEVKPPHAPRDDRHRVLCVETATPLIVARGMPRSYADQKKGDRSTLTAMLWGDRLDGAIVPAGDRQPGIYPCAFVGLEQGVVIPGDAHLVNRGDVFVRGNPLGDQWDTIHKARYWQCEARHDVHVALYTPGVFTPCDCPDIDRAYQAALSARFDCADSRTGSRPW